MEKEFNINESFWARNINKCENCGEETLESKYCRQCDIDLN